MTVDLNEHLKLIYFFLHDKRFRSYCKQLERDDAEQTIALGIARAATKFDPQKGAFSTYAFFWVRHELIRAVRLNKPVGNYLSGDAYAHVQSTNVEDMDDQTYWRYLTSMFGARSFSLDAPAYPRSGSRTLRGELFVESSEEQDDDKLVLQWLVDASDLTEREERVLYERFFEDKTLQEIGDALGVSRERVRQIEESALSKIKEIAYV